MRLEELAMANSEWRLNDTIKLLFRRGDVLSKTIKVYDAISDSLLRDLQVSTFSRDAVIINGRYVG